MEFERVPLPGWSWSVWSERQAAAASPPSSRRCRWQQQVDEPAEPTVHGSRWPASEFETADGRSELDAAAAARRQRWQRRRYERAKQQPSGPGPPTAAAAASSVTTAVPCADATVHVSWQRRRRWKFRIAPANGRWSFIGTDERRPRQPWNAKQQRWWRRRRIQQYAAKLRLGRRHESSSISWIKLFADAVGW